VLQLRQGLKEFQQWLFLLDFEWNADFETMKPFIRKITLEVLENRLPQGVVLNVNFPKLTRTTSKESKYVVKQKHAG
jgi:broad specificity polyphosphatase/5'/3'-nucleotidase SurE